MYCCGVLLFYFSRNIIDVTDTSQGHHVLFNYAIMFNWSYSCVHSCMSQLSILHINKLIEFGSSICCITFMYRMRSAFFRTNSNVSYIWFLLYMALCKALLKIFSDHYQKTICFHSQISHETQADENPTYIYDRQKNIAHWSLYAMQLLYWDQLDKILF